MSLETAITENTAAIRELIARLAAAAPIPNSPATLSGPALSLPPIVPPVSADEKAAVLGNAPPAAQAEAPAPSAPTAAAAPAVAPGAKAPTYNEHVKPLIIKVTQAKGRDAAVKLLADFGATTGTGLKPSQFADFILAAQKVLL